MQAPHWLTYDFPPEVREKLKLQWGSDWKGQAQKWQVYLTHIIKMHEVLSTLGISIKLN